MQQILPKSLLAVIDQLGQLPGVGARTAERYAYFLLKQKSSITDKLAASLTNLHPGVKVCPKTFALINPDQEISPLYDNPNRNRQLVALVEEPLDIVAIEKTGKFNGTYHVLGGVLSPVDDIGPSDLKIGELIERLKSDKVEELVIATNASVEGESTALYVQKVIDESGLRLRISRLAQGLPVGTDLEYADQITLGRALEGRKVIHDN